MKFLVTAFTKITGAIPMWVYYRPVVFCSPAAKKAYKQLRRKGRGIVIANHSTVYDYVVLLLLFPFRFVRALMAEILFKRGKLLAFFLRNMGGVYVDRNSGNLSFMSESISILASGGLLAIFPEGRLIKQGVQAPYSVSTVSIALKGGSPVTPIYIEPRKSAWRCTRVRIGEPIDVSAMCDSIDPPLDKLREIAEFLRGEVNKLQEQGFAKTSKEKESL